MRVAFFGAFDPAYPRNRVLREALESAGVGTVDIAVRPGAPTGVREAALLWGWASRSRGADAILVPSFGHRDVPVASMLGSAAGIPVLFDPLVSRWDTQVGDLGRVRNGGLTAARLRASDRIALAGADHVLCDTWEHGDFYSVEFQVPRSKLSRVPVGADRRAFARGEVRQRETRPPGGPLEIIYIGGFLPLHGVEVVVAAAAALESRHGPRFARFTLVGSGMTAPRAEREIARLGLRSVRKLPRASYPEALDLLARSDVALGIFGSTPKAARVVPHKVYQALAVGVPTVTRRSRAVAEFFREGEDVLVVPPGDPAALAGAIEALAAEPELRTRVGARGRATALDRASPERIGPALREILERARADTRGSRRR